MFRNKCYNLLPLRRTNDKIPPVFHSDEEALFCVHDEHPTATIPMEISRIGAVWWGSMDGFWGVDFEIQL